MIGTSDGEQFDNQFEHAVAQHGAPKPLGPPQTQRDPMGPAPGELEMRKEQEPFNNMYDFPGLHYVDPKGKFDDSPTDLSRIDKTVDEISGHQAELETKGAIHPDRFLEDLGINMPKSDLGFRPGDVQGDRLDRNPDYGAQQQRQFHPDSIRKDINLAPNVKSVLSQPHVAEAIANPKIDRTHDVPYEAGASAKPDDFTTHIDKSIPSSVTISGKTFDPAIPANIHEQVEREVMNNLIKKGMSNEKAYEIAHHEYAEPAEDAWYQAHGIDVGEVNKQWAKWDKGTEQERSTDKDFPKDLYKKPYAHNKVEGMKHEPSDVSAEWAMGDHRIHLAENESGNLSDVAVNAFHQMFNEHLRYNPAEALNPTPGQSMAAPRMPTPYLSAQAAARELGISQSEFIRGYRNYTQGIHNSDRVDAYLDRALRDPSFPSLRAMSRNADEELAAIRERTHPVDKLKSAPTEKVEGKLSVVKDDRFSAGTSHLLNLKDKNGETQGYINMHDRGDSLYVNMISSFNEANSFGTAATRDILRQIKDMYPEAKHIMGFRISGARKAAGKMGTAVQELK